MPSGGAFCSSQTGLEVARITPVELTTCMRRKLLAAVLIVWVTVPPDGRRLTPWTDPVPSSPGWWPEHRRRPK